MVIGDLGKMAAVLRNLSKFGIKELAMTGKFVGLNIALRRGKLDETAPFWRFSAASYPDLQKTIPIKDDNASKQIVEKNINGKLNGVSGGDVHPVEYDDDFYHQILDAHWGVLYEEDFGLQSHTLSILVNNFPGVLNLRWGLYPEEVTMCSLAVGPAEREGISRITTVVLGTNDSISKLVGSKSTHMPFAEREIMLIKIAANAATRRDVLDIANIFRAKPVDVSDHTITLAS
ncbi:hypothetical protein OROMI_018557 [Orobanche minor]